MPAHHLAGPCEVSVQTNLMQVFTSEETSNGETPHFVTLANGYCENLFREVCQDADKAEESLPQSNW